MAARFIFEKFSSQTLWNSSREAVVDIVTVKEKRAKAVLCQCVEQCQWSKIWTETITIDLRVVPGMVLFLAAWSLVKECIFEKTTPVDLCPAAPAIARGGQSQKKGIESPDLCDSVQVLSRIVATSERYVKESSCIPVYATFMSYLRYIGLSVRSMMAFPQASTGIIIGL